MEKKPVGDKMSNVFYQQYYLSKTTKLNHRKQKCINKTKINQNRQTMSNSLSIQEFKDLVKQGGRNFAVMEDMMRLGFVTVTDAEKEELKINLKELNGLYRRRGKIDSELGKLADIDTVLKKVRKLRIERVRKEREIKKALKAESLKEQKAVEAKRRQTTPPYLGEGVSAGLNYTDANTKRLEELGLPIINNAEELAEAMKLSVKQITWLSYHRGTSSVDHYNRFKIPKQKGGFRTIASPKPTLRKAQTWIFHRILKKLELHDAAMAFRPKRSIKNNAEAHKNGGVIIRMDLKDFFPSIKFRRIKGLFKSFGYNEAMATIFGLMCTDAARIEATLDNKKYFVALSDRYLPQGACTSPALTNIICRKLDKRMEGICKSRNFTYTRYADDLVLSHTDKDINVMPMINFTKHIIKEEGFIVHPDKTAIMRPHQRQSVTGIVVNSQPTISKRDLRNFRSFLHHYKTKGAVVMTQEMGKDATNYGKGYWSFIHMVSPSKAQKLAQDHPWLIKN